VSAWEYRTTSAPVCEEGSPVWDDFGQRHCTDPILPRGRGWDLLSTTFAQRVTEDGTTVALLVWTWRRARAQKGGTS